MVQSCIAKIKENWNYFSVHIWLLLSSYGIIFAILSFIEDLGGLDNFKSNYPWIKGFVAIFIGFLFYICIGIPHITGAKNM
jgi:hypothetical protein